MLVAFASVVGLNCTTPTASFLRTPPSQRRASLVAVCRRAVFGLPEGEGPRHSRLARRPRGLSRGARSRASGCGASAC